MEIEGHRGDALTTMDIGHAANLDADRLVQIDYRRGRHQLR